MPVITLSARVVHYHQRAANFFVDFVRAVVWPNAEFLMRLWIARIFVASALVKLADWQTALQLSAHEYPLGSLSAVTETYLGVSLELIAGTLLALGAFTRLAAIALFSLSLTIQVTYKPFDNQLFWMALFAWYAVSGPGRISLDHLFARGLERSALPGMARASRVIRFVTADIKPLVLSVLRVWLALALLSTTTDVGRSLLEADPSLKLWLPTSTAAILPTFVARIGGILLLAGFGSRYVAAAVFVALLAGSMFAGQMLETAYLFMLFGIFFVDGSGWLSLDHAGGEYFRRRFESLLSLDLHSDPSVPRVVIVGAGFGGISCVQGLRNTRVAVTLIDRANYQLFQPLLYQVATAALSPGDIAAPIRPIFREMRGLRFILGAVTAIDTSARHVMVAAKKVPYDFLVLATGATHSYFGNERWAAAAPGLKRMENALEIRRRVLTAFELAEGAATLEEQRALLTFLIVGGGPTGVELAGAIAELAKYGMSREFRSFDPASARVILVQSGPVVLPTFPHSLSEVAAASLKSLGVEVLLSSRVEEIDADGARVNGVDIPAKTVLWAAGVTASPAGMWLAAAQDSAGRIKVGPDLSVPGLVNTYAIGDTALSTAWKGKPVPGLAPAAKQGGAYVARTIRAAVEGRASGEPFRYRHLGSLATIGRKAAVADFGFIRLWGAPAWWLWGVIHVGFLVGARNRASTLINWFWAYLTFGGSARLTSVSDAMESHNEPIVMATEVSTR